MVSVRQACVLSGVLLLMDLLIKQALSVINALLSITGLMLSVTRAGTTSQG